MPEQPQEAYRARMIANREVLARAEAWLAWITEQRTQAKSWGEQTLRIQWQDGLISSIAVGDLHTFRPRQDGVFPILPGEIPPIGS